MSKLGDTPHVRLHIDKEGQLYLFDTITKEKQLISMRTNSDGSKTSRDTAAKIEDAIWDFRYDHQSSQKPAPKRPSAKKSKAQAPSTPVEATPPT